MVVNNNFIGSNFDDFLKEEGIFEEVEAIAVKRSLALELQKIMKQEHISKTEMAARMKTSRSSLNRLLNPESESVTLETLERAAHAVGKKLHLEFV
jgi:DNA-binding Xre family transcriptional regulator